MSRNKTILSVIAILGLGGLMFYLYRDWFAVAPIQISYRVSPWLQSAARGRGRPAADVGTPVIFSLNTYLRLTSVKVVIAAEIQTNKFAHPVWELVSESNSVPTASFAYGQRLRGMHSAVKDASADPLAPGVIYRLFLKTRDKEAQHDFTTTPPRPQP